MRGWKVALLAAGSVIAGAVVFLYWIFFGPNIYDTEKKVFFVSKGQTWDQVVDSLGSQNIVRSKEWFVFVTRVLHRSNQVYVGKYEFTSGISNVELYSMLRQGRGRVPIVVTLREGRRSTSYARGLAKALGIDSSRFMQLVDDPAFARTMNIPAKSLEGYLAADTYEFNWQTDEDEIIRRLVRQTQKIFDDTVVEQARRLRMSMHQVLTLASIIEGEVIDTNEREVISGVYHNRLRRSMNLQADPTIQYIIPNGPRRIYYSDLRIASPYNTYRHLGLPPGPISNPGKASILAAVNPAKHKYVFFVANGKGGHWFASNYREHLRNAKRYRHEREMQMRTVQQL
ncbi:MAG: endolytic transglycosylase MltG [Ignavibacteriae bacterium]|nr:endolytic transglycosylase MltG [Ignavibacteriota bacterium]